MKTLIITGLLATMSYAPISAQTTEVLSGTLSTSKTLNASTCYELDGCYRVLSGGDLIIPAGTQIRANSQASLVIQQGGQIFANGSSSNPVVFTYAQTDVNGDPVEWDGIYIAGAAQTNQVAPSLVKSCPGTINYGGINDADNSGTLQHVRIEYAGVAPTGDPQAGALNLYAVGTGTSIDHVQISYSKKEAYELVGGKVDLSYIESLNNYRNDMRISQGYTGNIAYLTAIRLDASAHDNPVGFSNGLWIYNDPTGTTATPKTHPVISNATFFGPGYCGATPHSDFRAAVRLSLNAEAEIYNSVFTGWTTGLEIIDNSTINNANVNGTIKMEYNTFYANGTNFANSPVNFDPTSAGCATTITNWMVGATPCQVDNLVRTSLTGYNSNVCGNYCSMAPTMTLSATNNVGAADYTWDVGGNFVPTTYRGSLTNTNWSSSWSEWCPQNAEYCSLALMKADKHPSLLFVPNPASDITLIQFETDVLGQVQVTVSDKVTGGIIRSANKKIEVAGKQELSLSVAGLREGVYPVQVRLSNGQIIAGQLIVR